MNARYLTPIQLSGIERARAILRGIPATEAEVLARLQSGDYEDDAPSDVQCARHGLVRLDADMPTDSGAQWQQVAVTGTFLGYRDGEQPFQFTPDTFQSIIKNFRVSPQYRPDGTGLVVPYDVGHQSTQPGNPPASYAAVGWIGELETRPTDGGGVGLWALTRWTPDMASAIRDGEFAFSSVVVEFSSIDPVTGLDVGPTLSSVAATNSPFLQGLQRLVASRTVQSPQGNNMPPKQLTVTLPRSIAPGSIVASQLITAALKLAAGKAEVAKSGSPADINNASPDWAKMVNITPTRMSEIINQARALGFNGGTPAPTCLAWLRGLGADTIAELGLDDSNRAAVVVGSILLGLARESQSSGSAPNAPNLDPVHDLIPTPLSRQPIDARNFPGNAHQRAIAACRAASPKFAAAPWDEQVHAASQALRDGRVVVA